MRVEQSASSRTRPASVAIVETALEGVPNIWRKPVGLNSYVCWGPLLRANGGESRRSLSPCRSIFGSWP